ncbi:hypothetical protein [Deinococcus maricopensis]|uniref:Uncharacterized protein n=1 Tax=Deinococcus maricopensis (strain DSM 21211 / LMG 22137 / NRRL B-23946 / LB-34) TaxID=709986 RepID=E8U517_DEIML|nr:hypothetical protein [Deinococcus maricopensis]ADV66156.1 hypothetical protein Deima_0497 [Deinococcus maricopensis DSM 21211]
MTTYVPTMMFPGIPTLPAAQTLPEGELYTFRFNNGYGAHVMRAPNLTFELAALSFARGQGEPIYDLPFCEDVAIDLTIEQAAALIRRLEALPRHPQLSDALMHEEF